MNRKMLDEVLQDLTGNLQLAVEQIHRESISEQAMQQALCRARARAVAPIRHGRLLRRGFLACGAAAAILLSLTPWIGSPSYSWGEVVQAVRKVPWLHSISKGPGNDVQEFWLSPAQGISASRWDKRVEYRDHKLRIYWSYDPEESVLYRLPELRDQRRTYYLRMMDTLEGLLHADPKADQTLAYLELGGHGDQPVQVIDEKHKSVKDEAGRSWLEYEFKIRDPDLTDAVHMTVRVDPQTKLPHLWRTEALIDKEKLSREVVFDYPEKGPEDAYAIGVPRSARVVDRIPKDDLARLMAGVKAARQRFDSYCALVVQADDKEEWWQGRPSQIWRKGNRWRMDFPIAKFGQGQQPPVGANQVQWWHDRAKEVPWMPSMRSDGTATYWITAKVKLASDPKKSTYEVTETKKTPELGTEDDPLPAVYALMPEFLSHPPMGIGGQGLEPVLELQPRDGPPGAVLLSVRQVGKMPAAQRPKDLPPAPDLYKYWIDPGKSYVAMRWQMGEGANEDIFIIEELAQSPSGHWYPTVVRRKNAIQDADGKRRDMIYRFYVDFNAPLPDTLFQPPK